MQPPECTDGTTDALLTFLSRVPMFQAVERESVEQRRLWRACELCTFIEYRLNGTPDPRGLSDDEIASWSRRGLSDGERLSDPGETQMFRPFWIQVGGDRIGTVAIMTRDTGWSTPNLWVSSFYLFPEHRRSGYGRLVMATLEGAARHTGYAGIRLDTDWLWQPAVRFYLGVGYWVQNWKRGLCLVRRQEDPVYCISTVGTRMELSLHGHQDVLIQAHRDRDTLIWDEQPGFERLLADDLGVCWPLRSTFALQLAVAGWPLIRGTEEWAQRGCWCDTGMPEGLADKIQLFEALARRDGFRVETPRIPGLRYPDWKVLFNDT